MQSGKDLPALKGRLELTHYFKGELPDEWEQSFHGVSPQALMRRLESAAGPGNDVRIKIDPRYNDDVRPPIVEAVHAKLFHNRPIKDDNVINTLSFKVENGDCFIKYAEFSREDMGKNIAKRYLAEIASLAKDMGCKTISLKADLSVGGYAWARYGFYPKNNHQWDQLKEQVRKKIIPHDGGYAVKHNGTRPLTETEHRAVTAILASDDPRDCWHLLELNRPVGRMRGHELTVGKALLMGTKWEGTMELDESKESYQRFLAYTGQAKSRQMGMGA